MNLLWCDPVCNNFSISFGLLYICMCKCVFARKRTPTFMLCLIFDLHFWHASFGSCSASVLSFPIIVTVNMMLLFSSCDIRHSYQANKHWKNVRKTERERQLSGCGNTSSPSHHPIVNYTFLRISYRSIFEIAPSRKCYQGDKRISPEYMCVCIYNVSRTEFIKLFLFILSLSCTKTTYVWETVEFSWKKLHKLWTFATKKTKNEMFAAHTHPHSAK